MGPEEVEEAAGFAAPERGGPAGDGVCGGGGDGDWFRH